MGINVIPKNMEKYMAFMLGKHLVFIDSLQFMSSSLEKSESNLPNDPSEKIKNYTELRLVKQKYFNILLKKLKTIKNYKP